MVRKSNSLKRLLSEKEYREYRSVKDIPQRLKLKRQIAIGKENLKEEARKQKLFDKEMAYRRSTQGRIASSIQRGFRNVRQGATRTIYQRTSSGYLQPRSSNISGGSGRGRKKGSYDPRYAQYGGVYGYRKAMALERFKQKQEILRRTAITPRQQEVLRQIQARDEMRMRSPESQVFPDTTGNIPLNNIMWEIEKATNLVD